MSAAAISARPGSRRAATSRSQSACSAQCNYDGYFLEYDSERAGGFEPLRFLPKGNKIVVVGVITSKSGTLESKDTVKRRIDEAAKYAPLEQLALSPQCGFASTEEGNVLTEEQQWAKMREVVEIAEEVWGSSCLARKRAIQDPALAMRIGVPDARYREHDRSEPCNAPNPHSAPITSAACCAPRR